MLQDIRAPRYTNNCVCVLPTPTTSESPRGPCCKLLLLLHHNCTKAWLTVCTDLPSDVALCLRHAVPSRQRVLRATVSLRFVRQVWEARTMTSLHAFIDQQQNEKQGTLPLGWKLHPRRKAALQAGFGKHPSLRPSQSSLQRKSSHLFLVRANFLLTQAPSSC